jgi:DNA-binding IclR family transcriptional regulator
MRGVERMVAIFECFSPQRPSLTLQEISNSIGLAKSTTFRIVQSLERTGYLIRLEDQKYCLSFRFTRLAGSVMSTLSIRQVARPLMFELARQTNETVTLNMTSGRDRVCIEVIDTPAPLMSMARQGQNVALTGKGATGKMLMAHLAPKEMERIVAPATKALAKRAEMMTKLARVRKAGYCVSHGERVLGLSAIAAPIWESDGSAQYCITITAPTVRLKPRIDEFVKVLVKASRDISRRLGADVEMPPMRSDLAKPSKTTHDARAPRRARSLVHG